MYATRRVSLPPYAAFHLSPDRTLWIVDFHATTDTGGAATALGNGTPTTFDTNRVVMREVDDDGVVSLAVYRLVRR